MEAAAPEKLLEAFRVLDVDGKGVISKDYIAKLMMEEGEPFTQVQFYKLIWSSATYDDFFLGGIRRNDGHGGRHTIRRHSIRILHQLTDGKFNIHRSAWRSI